jgi:competence protein ComEC
LELTVFNVGHGLSVMLQENPENYITLIDLGADDNLSPIKYLNSKNLRADQIFITHPHADHISEIDKVLLPENMPDGFYVQDYDWKDVTSREQEQLRDKIDVLQKVKTSIPDCRYKGNAELKCWGHPPLKAINMFGESRYINNSSLAIIYKWCDFKIAILGDLETDALKNFCEFEEFVDFAKNTYLLIAPHHGHDSGFPELWVNNIGKPNLTLISIKESDPHVCKRYLSADFNQGVTINGQTRYTLTTRKDGTIKVNMYYQANQATWNFTFE